MTSSRDTGKAQLPPSAAPAYLHRLAGSALSRRGFDGAEAGALAEMERLLEHHLQRLFSQANDYAAHAGRGAPNARDLLVAQEASGWDLSTLRRESKRKRSEIVLVTEEEEPEPLPPVTLATMSDGDDVKPMLRKAPEYAWDGAPALPDPWTYKPDRPSPPPPPASRVTTGVLDFIKLTATERGDIPPELGLVDYRRVDGREARRQWGVKGVGTV